MTIQSLLWAVGALLAVLGLIAAATRLLQFGISRSPQRPGRTLIVRESITLDSRRRLHLVECGERKVLLLTGNNQDLVIGWMQDP